MTETAARAREVSGCNVSDQTPPAGDDRAQPPSDPDVPPPPPPPPLPAAPSWGAPPPPPPAPWSPGTGYGPQTGSGQAPLSDPPPYGQVPPSAPPPYGQAPPYGPPPYGQVPPAVPYGYAPVPVDRLGRPLASWWQRLLGILIDVVILGVPKGIVTAAVVGTTARNGIFAVDWAVDATIIGIVFAVIDLTYFGLLNGGDKGQTVGQMALGITVRDETTGGPIGPQRAGLRILVLYPGILVAWVPILGSLAGLYSIVAGLSPLWDRRRQGVHDKVAHTDVIRVR
jgi:uncharacterized RDD family membrane protein YckC